MLLRVDCRRFANGRSESICPAAHMPACLVASVLYRTPYGSIGQTCEPHLLGQVRRAAVGDRLPTVRWLMREFGLSQVSVQRELAELKASGLIAAEAGRGTFVVGHPSHALDEAQPIGAGSQRRSVLILRRLAGVRRGRVVLDALQRRLTELDYRDPRGRLLRRRPRTASVAEPASVRRLRGAELLRDDADRDARRRPAQGRRHHRGWCVARRARTWTPWGSNGASPSTEPSRCCVSRATGASRSRPPQARFSPTSLAGIATSSCGRRADDPRFAPASPASPRTPLSGLRGGARRHARAPGPTRPGELPFTGLIAWGIESGALSGLYSTKRASVFRRICRSCSWDARISRRNRAASSR